MEFSLRLQRILTRPGAVLLYTVLLHYYMQVGEKLEKYFVDRSLIFLYICKGVNGKCVGPKMQINILVHKWKSITNSLTNSADQIN